MKIEEGRHVMRQDHEHPVTFDVGTYGLHCILYRQTKTGTYNIAIGLSDLCNPQNADIYIIDIINETLAETLNEFKDFDPIVYAREKGILPKDYKMHVEFKHNVVFLDKKTSRTLQKSFNDPETRELLMSLYEIE